MEELANPGLSGKLQLTWCMCIVAKEYEI